MATDRRPAAASYAPQLDGLRTAAVTAVAWSHWLPAWQFGLPLGAGVHLFFVLSGFLITRILLGLREAPDRRTAIGRFYLRRALRLFPAFYVVVAVAWLADVPLTRDTWPWHATYLSNLYIAERAQWQGHLSHFWSLAVEEQFYVLWPWLVIWTPSRALGPVIALTALSGPLAHLVAAAAGLGEPFWALVPLGSADSLGLGAWIAWRAWASPVADAGPWARALAVGLTGWTALAVWEATGHVPESVAVWRQFLQGLVFVWVVQRAVAGFGGWAGSLLANRAVVAVGRISYGVYLVHAFAPMAVDVAARAVGVVDPAALAPGLRAALSAAMSVALAAALWRLVEAPAHRLKARL